MIGLLVSGDFRVIGLLGLRVLDCYGYGASGF